MEKNYAVVSIDMQTKCLNSLGENSEIEHIVNSHKKVMQTAVSTNTPIFLVEFFGYGKMRKELLDFHEKNNAGLYIKNKKNAFSNDEFRSRLNELEITDIVVMGISANGCIKDTILNSPKNYAFHTSKDTLGIPKAFKQHEKSIMSWYEKNTNHEMTYKSLIKHFL